MPKRNTSTAGYTESMIEHRKILEFICNKYEGFEWYRLCGGRDKYLCLEYLGTPVLVLEGKKSKGYGQLGTKCKDRRIIGNPLEVQVSKKADPEPDSLYTRYRYRPGWMQPYTIMFDSYEKILPEVEKIIAVVKEQ